MKIKHVQNPIRYFPVRCLGLSFPTAGITQLAPLCLGILAVKPAAYIGPAECAQGPKLLIEIILSSSTLLHSGSPNHGWLLKLYRQTEWIEGFPSEEPHQGSIQMTALCFFQNPQRGREDPCFLRGARHTPFRCEICRAFGFHMDDSFFSSLVQRSDHYPAMHNIQSTSTPPKPFQHLTLRGTNEKLLATCNGPLKSIPDRLYRPLVLRPTSHSWWMAEGLELHPD